MLRVRFNTCSSATNSPEPEPFRYDEDSSGRVKVVPYAQVRFIRPAVKSCVECANPQFTDIQIRT